MKIQLGPSMKTTVFFIFVILSSSISEADAATIAKEPLFLTSSVPPIVMLTMERDHKLYYEAYNDASDINADGILDVRYNPTINYFGYFDSQKCYSYGSGKFTPTTGTISKKCSSAWSGDFLNYLTTSRMDALRRVLYGGKRSTDTTTSTVLERSYIPQDAHSWGKEYTSEAIDGYKISDYTPLAQPTNATRHLFANTTLLCPSGNSDPGCNSNSGLPLLRVLNDSAFRVWEWLSIERPVAGVQCATGNNSRSNCAVAGSTASLVIVPTSYFSNLQQTTYNATAYNSSPANKSEFDSLESSYKVTTPTCTTTIDNNKCIYGTTTATQINGSGNPNSSVSGSQDNYLTIFSGTLVIPTGQSGTYTFAIDGDDAIDFFIDDVSSTPLVGWYGGHAKDSTALASHSGSKFLSEGNHTIKFRHQERGGSDNYYLYMQKTIPASSIADYVVRVDACVSGLLEKECRGYPTAAPTAYKPAGLLQEYGEGDKMAFGLITGSYAKNVSGGVLRKNISSITNEIEAATGKFTTTTGIINTINALKIVGFTGDYYYNSNCGVPEVGGPLAEGRCRMWGNPTGEMMYEGLRYFAGKATPTTGFSIASTGNDDSDLALPLPTWLNPYRTTSGGYLSCAKPSQLVISDINPNYDTDQLPGRHTYITPSTTPAFTGDITDLNVETLADTIWAKEYGSSQSLFIGQSGGTYDGAPTAKTVTSFGNMRGLAPEGPTLQGGYYAGSIGLYGRLNDVNGATGKQNPDTLSVALASPLPRIIFPLATKTITLVPFAKTVGGCGSISTAQGAYQPTNTIVDFYVDTIKNTDVSNTDSNVNDGKAYAKFRINYEDSEYGSDHDMDAIAEYELTAKSNDTVDIKVSSNYAAGGCIQHMGYVISGTSADGTYLEARDPDTASGSDIDYYLDTPNTTGVALPTTHTRNFSLGNNTSSSFVAHDPLWYAAKWGVADKNGDGILDTNEWDAENNTTPNGLPDGVPDGYFLVTNASQLTEQLGKAFARLVDNVSAASAVAANTTKLNTGTLVYQARFDPRDWSGQLLALAVDKDTGAPLTSSPNWEAATVLPPAADRKIYTYNPAATAGSRGILFQWDNLTTLPSGTSQQDYLNQLSGVADAKGSDRVNWLRGDNAKEYRFGGTATFRNRIKRFVNDTFLTSSNDLKDKTIKTNKLGDIVNSDPIYVGTDDFGYSSLPGAEGSDYTTFRTSSNYLNRIPMIYMGANDGMLHGFDARKNADTFTDGGKEIFAYIPNALFPELSKLTMPTYQHQYYVDGISSVSDVYYDGGWHTLLAGATGAGARALFTLNITTPDSFGPSSALWEFTNVDDSDLGYTFGQPVMGKMNDTSGSWVVIAANGYNSDSGHAVLFILNAKTGALIKKIDTGIGSTTNKNGLSSPVAVDTNNDKKIDVIYAGDLYGNLWKFDVSNSSTTNWAVANSGSPLFVACAAAGTTCSASNLQPITGKPSVGAVGPDQSSGIMVYFGTGKYFETTDGIVPTSPQVETFYGLWDNNAGKITDRANLQTQTIDFEGAAVNNSNATSSTVVRATSRNTVCYSTSTTPATDDDTLTTTCTSSNLKRGWLMDLIVKPANTPKGERVVTPPVMYLDMVIFSTIIPSADPCESGGDSRLMLLEAVTGKRSSSSNFDLFGGTASSPSLSKDGKVDNADLVKVNGKLIAASGVDLGIGIHKNLSIVASHGYASGSSGDLGNITLKSTTTTTTGGSTSGKRVSWRQLR